MGVLVILIACSLLLAGSFLWAFYSGQFEDDYTPSIRMLMDDETIENSDAVIPAKKWPHRRSDPGEKN